MPPRLHDKVAPSVVSGNPSDSRIGKPAAARRALRARRLLAAPGPMPAQGRSRPASKPVRGQFAKGSLTALVRPWRPGKPSPLHRVRVSGKGRKSRHRRPTCMISSEGVADRRRCVDPCIGVVRSPWSPLLPLVH